MALTRHNEYNKCYDGPPVLNLGRIQSAPDAFNIVGGGHSDGGAGG
jgi:hypothetical protein